MSIFKSMINTLQNKPGIGILCGFISSLFVSVKDFLSDDSILNWVRIMGIWLGFFIALATGILKIIELIRLLKHKK